MITGILVILILLSKSHSSDKFRALVVISLIGMIGSAIAMLNQIDNVNANWNTYKCNPIIIPLAPMFGRNPYVTFTDCIQTIQRNNIGVLIAPIQYNMSLITSLGSELSGSIAALTEGAEAMVKGFSNVGGDFATGFDGISTEMTRFVYNLRDSFGKIGGVMNTLLKAAGASVITAKSMGKACFSPNTIVWVNGGKAVPIKDVQLGDVMDGTGAVVLATMRLKNTNESGEQIETMYCIDDIVVSGSHLVYDDMKDGYLSVSEYADSHNIRVSHDPVPELVCLITSNHTIPIGNHTFHDWEDNQGSPSKSIRTVKYNG